MKVKIQAQGFNSISYTTAVSVIETCIKADELDYILGKLIYTLELSGYGITTHEVFTEFKRNSSKINFSALTSRYLPIVNNKFNNVKVMISLAKA